MRLTRSDNSREAVQVSNTNDEPGDWTFTQVDCEIAGRLRSVIPSRLFDVHAHLYRTCDLGEPAPALASRGPGVVDAEVWRNRLSQCVGADRLIGALFFPYPAKGGNVRAANEFLISQLDLAELIRGLILVTPEAALREVGEHAAHPRVCGFKPYHLFAGGPDTFEAEIEDYAPEWVWGLAHERRLVIMLHLVRSRALSDPGNQRSILRLCSKYPDAKLILAHAGRGFHAPNTIDALPVLRGIDNLWFDSSAICEPEALMAVIKTLGPGRLLWGSDFPVSHQRGKCATVGDAFSWVCPRRIDVDPTAPTCHPTLVGLESLRALAVAAQLLDLTSEDLDRIFFRNAVQLLGMTGGVS